MINFFLIEEHKYLYEVDPIHFQAEHRDVQLLLSVKSYLILT